MNWYLILSGTSYFDQFQRPPLLRHLWSLAVEEQFYLLWPLALAGLLMLFRKRPDRLFIAMLALALASTVLMALLYHPVDPSLVYYGTDTRIGGLMLGCCLALFWHPRQLQAGVPPVKPRAVASAGVLGTGRARAPLRPLHRARRVPLPRRLPPGGRGDHRRHRGRGPPGACASAAGSASRSSSTSACGPTASTSGTGRSSPSPDPAWTSASVRAPSSSSGWSSPSCWPTCPTASSRRRSAAAPSVAG